MRILFTVGEGGKDVTHIAASQTEMRELAANIRLALIRCTTEALMVNIEGTATICEEGAEELE